MIGTYSAISITVPQSSFFKRIFSFLVLTVYPFQLAACLEVSCLNVESQMLKSIQPIKALMAEDAPLLAIPAFDRIAGLYNRHLNSNWGICLC
jgi:hypothetical protein